MEAFVMEKAPQEHVFMVKSRSEKRGRSTKEKDKIFMKYVHPLNVLLYNLHKEFYDKLDKDIEQTKLRMIISEIIEIRDKLLVRYHLCEY